MTYLIVGMIIGYSIFAYQKASEQQEEIDWYMSELQRNMLLLRRVLEDRLKDEGVSHDPHQEVQ